MKKIIALLLIISAVYVSCRPLSKDNPYDPSAPGYIKIHYLREAWYPANTVPVDIVFSNGFLYMAAVNQGAGNCVIKVIDSAGTSLIASTPLGAFTNISGICADASGNIYISDDKAFVQVMDSSNSFTSFSLPNITAPGNTHIEWAAGSIYLASENDKKLYRYTAGVPAVPDSVILSCTANGYFTPWKVFKAGSYIYVINKDKKYELAKFNPDLSSAGTVLFQRDISDCAETGTEAQALSSQAAFKVDYNLSVALKWGDYGEGPGKLMNGSLVTYDAAGKLLYILDGGSIKVFGE